MPPGSRRAPPASSGGRLGLGGVWYRLHPNEAGTQLEHGFRVVEPKSGAAIMKVFSALSRREQAIRRGMRRTLQNVKAAAEGL
jgi:hypothetical protein